MTNDLAARREAATKAEAALEAKPGDGALLDAYITAQGAYNGALIRLHRSGDLVLIDREGMREAVDSLSGVKAWLQRWAAHVGNCRGDHTCTCGLKRAKYDLDLADAAIAAMMGEKP